MGYTDVSSMSGGFQAWKSSGRPWTTPVVLSREQKQRYSRHLLIPEVGAEGQAKLLGSKALFIGAGGLGAPGLLYLAAAGVGTIGVVDFDVVDVSNLQRQVIHTTDRVGQKKVESAAQTIRALNPDVTVIPHEEMLTEANVDRLIAGYDVILDGTDTFETRYTLNDAAVRARIPVVHASVFRFEGQLSVFKPFDGPVLSLPVSHAATTGARTRLLGRGCPGCRARASWACSRRPRRSRCCWTSVTRCPAGCSSTTPSTAPSTSSSCGATRIARPAAMAPRWRPTVRRLHPGSERMTAVRIPPVLRAQVGGQKQVEVTGDTVGQVHRLAARPVPLAPGAAADPRGDAQPVRQRLRQRPRRALRAGAGAPPVSAADTVVLLPAMAGG